MPVHDWSRVEAGIFHNFHVAWIGQIVRVLNNGWLPSEYYALAEQRLNPFEADVLTLKSPSYGSNIGAGLLSDGGLLLAPPKIKPVAKSDIGNYRRKQNRIAIRHISDDELVAAIEIVSPSNKSSRDAMQEFIAKTCELFLSRIHVSMVDIHPPTRRDPQGIHGAIWDEYADQPYEGPLGKPFTVASYEVGADVSAYVDRFAVGEPIPEMPLFLKLDAQIPLPLEQTYQTAWEAVPKRWRAVLEAP